MPAMLTRGVVIDGPGPDASRVTRVEPWPVQSSTVVRPIGARDN